jgi:5-(carboxyamino)imidazole ribonucleotide mutase
MPPGMPVATVGVDRGDNAALLALQIIGVANDSIAKAIVAYRETRTNAVIADDQALQEERGA